LMVKKDYISRKIHETDRRKFNLEITKKGIETIALLTPTIQKNRTDALAGLSENEIILLDQLLTKVLINCKTDHEK
jgi:DNA-binding MarR family transcriptional regulator